MVTLIVLRHAHSVGNAVGMRQGQTDVPLSTTGYQQAPKLSTVLPNTVEKIYHSDLRRAAETVEYGGSELPTESSEKIREMDFGKHSGSICDITDDRLPYAVEKHPTPEEGWPNGENTFEFHNRISEFLQQIVHNHSPNETIAIITHQGVIHALRDMSYGYSPGEGDFKSNNNLSGYKFILFESTDGFTISEESELTFQN